MTDTQLTKALVEGDLDAIIAGVTTADEAQHAADLMKRLVESSLCEAKKLVEIAAHLRDLGARVMDVQKMVDSEDGLEGIFRKQ